MSLRAILALLGDELGRQRGFHLGDGFHRLLNLLTDHVVAIDDICGTARALGLVLNIGIALISFCQLVVLLE